MSYFQPTDLSGLFLWFRSTDIGPTTDGAAITYWPDMSGSGNDVTATGVQSPTFKTNIVNGYPVARFNGSSNYLTKSNNPTLNLSPSSLTLFVVYQTFSDVQTQCLCANDNSNFHTAKCGFTQMLNYGGAGSGWHWAWGKDSIGIGENIITASYNGNGQLFTKNEFLIRTDFFHPLTQMFTWARSSTQISNGVGSMSISNANSFKIGSSDQQIGVYLNGDVAEVVGYNRMLSLSEIDQVHIYLLYKYALNPTEQLPLFVFAETDPISGIYLDFPLVVSGAVPISSGFPLFTKSTGSNNLSTTLYIGASTSISGGFSLYMDNTIPINSGFPLYTYGISSGLISAPLYIGSSTSVSSGFPLYTYGVGYYDLGASLFIFPTQPAFSGMTLYTARIGSGLGQFPLYIGSTTPINYQFPLVVNASFFAQTGIPLYLLGGIEHSSTSLFTWGDIPFSGGITLYTAFASSGTAHIPLYTYGYTSGNAGMSLYTNTPSTLFPINSGIFPLFINSIQTGSNDIHGSVSLYMGGTANSGFMPLYIQTTPLITSGTIGVGPFPLYMYGPQTTGTNSNSFTLFVQNNTQIQTSPRLKMWIRGDGIMDGASIANGNMNLVINTLHGQDNSLPLYIGSTSIPNSSLSLFIDTTFNINSGVSLYVPGAEIGDGFSLFMGAGGSFNSGLSLIINAQFEEESISLYSHGF